MTSHSFAGLTGVEELIVDAVGGYEDYEKIASGLHTVLNHSDADAVNGMSSHPPDENGTADELDQDQSLVLAESRERELERRKESVLALEAELNAHGITAVLQNLVATVCRISKGYY